MGWQISPDYQNIKDAPFVSLDGVFSLKGDSLTRDPISKVYVVDCGQHRYYVKQYFFGGKKLKRYLGRSRACAEWQNLQHFKNWGIAVPDLVAWGEERRAGIFFRRGSLVTAELEGTVDLATLAKSKSPLLGNARWVNQVSEQLAEATRKMHDHRFAHNDLKWRNVLVGGSEDQPQVFFIDCPAGTFWFGPFLKYRIIKDLACLDKVAKYQLSRSQRLRFYMRYAGIDSLTDAHKKQIRKVLRFFAGRE